MLRPSCLSVIFILSLLLIRSGTSYLVLDLISETSLQKLPSTSIFFSSACEGMLSVREFAHQPGSRHLPVAHHSLGRDPEHFGRLFHAQAAKELQLHNLRLARINALQQLQ